MNILIIGANSYIGRSFIKKAEKIKKLNLFLATSDKAISSKKNKKKIIYIDLLKKNLKKNFFLEKIDIVIDFGWIGVFGEQRNSKKQLKNILYTKNLIKLIKKLTPTVLISFGSQAEYGNIKLKRKESIVCKPNTLYGKIKLHKFNLLNKCAKKNNIRLVWFRIFASYGPDEKHDWLIPYVIKKIILNKKISVTKGVQKMDYIFIEDVISAIFLAINENNMNGIYNLAYGKSYKIKNIILKIKNLINKNFKINFGIKVYRNDENFNIQSDITKLKSLGWKPRYNLDLGLKKTVNYYKNLK